MDQGPNNTIFDPQARAILLEKITYLTGLLMPVLTLPQAYEILINKHTYGASLITWAFYLFGSAIFAAYGLIHKQKLLVVTYIPFTIIELAIVIGLVAY